MKQLVRNVKIISTGSYIPNKVYTNKFLETAVDGVNAEWIKNTLGIEERHVVTSKEHTSTLAAEAGLTAIKNSNLSIDDIELVIVATATPDRLAPSTACLVQDLIKTKNAVCFDLSAVCSGFLFAMSTAAQFIASGVYNNALVIGADTFSTVTDWTDRNCVFFGDGAGAVVLTHTGKEEGFLAFNLYSDGRGKDSFTIPRGSDQTFRMVGQDVYNTATSVLPEAINKILSDTNLSIEDIDYMIPHQPSIGILKKTAELVGLPFKKVMTNMAKYANTAGATIPLLLDEVYQSGTLSKGNTILFAAVGSGWTWGTSIIKWSID